MLSPDRFGSFVSEVHDGRSPFPWQEALLYRVVDEGRWPDAIDVPTGLGKTSVLDVAVFAAALGLPVARRRIFYVVDRRLVVDEAHEHARRLGEALADPGPRTVTAEVARRLTVPDDRRPLDVTRMRGGATWDRIWLDRPDRYAIITGTVDQVGSRLLFRGYGVSERSRSIDAALVGTDSLVIIDEAHLSAAFVTTVTAALAVDQVTVTPQPIVMTMSATTSDQPGTLTHRITPADERHPVAGRRLLAQKHVHLVEVKTSKAAADRDVPAAMADLANAMAPGRVVGVIANTVARARAVFELVTRKNRAVLLTGRTRQVDRDYLLHEFYPDMRVGRDRSEQQSLIVVATQTVEVGANIDFDALVTESAPLSSLVQRLGRLNRMAECTAEPALAIVVQDTSVDTNDPVYGAARLTTWTWLSEQTTVHRYRTRLDLQQTASGLDASPTALRRLQQQCPAERLAAMHSIQSYVPLLHRSIVDTWVRTAPAPVPDQPIEPFLHGLRDSPPPVTVIWRAGLHRDPERWSNQVDMLPPAAEEGIDLNIRAIRHWLRDRSADPNGTDLDVVATDTPDQRDDIESFAIRRVLRYRGRGDAEPIPPWRIRPGDTIVVPADIGGCDSYGWNPSSTAPVIDVADLIQRRGRPVVRLGPTLARAVHQWDSYLDALVQQLIDQAAKDIEAATRPTSVEYGRVLAGIREKLATRERQNTPFGDVVAALLRPGMRPVVATEPAETAGAGTASHIVLTVRAAQLADDDTDLGSSSTATQRTGLDAHERAVARRANEFARNLSLPAPVIASITRAARWHDEGKRDPRFQVMLWSGDRVAAELADQPLAKSNIEPTDRRALAHARQAAAYPRGMRHEALSARIAAHRTTDEVDIDAELVLHLIASHHGLGRPLLPPITDPAPTKVDIDGVGAFDTSETIDWTQPRRFNELNNLYGRWGLALLETTVRLADIWCSIHNEEADEPTEEQP